MPTVIDSLVVKLGLDAKDLDSKSPVAERKLKGIETQADKTVKSFENIAKTAGTFLALIGGTMAIKKFTLDTIDSAAALGRFAQNLGLSVETISAWGHAAEELGGSAKSVQGTMDMLSRAQTELRLTGQSSLVPYLAALGVALADTAGKARPVDDVLLDLSDRFSHMDRTTANNMGRMMGIDQDTMNLLLQSRRELELTIKRQKEHNAVTKQQADEARKQQRSIADLKQTWEAFGRSLLAQASPALEKLLDLLLRFGNWVQQNQEFIVDFLKVLAVGLGAIALLTAPINLTVVAVLVLAAAIALLWQDYQTWKRGGTSFIDWSKWEPGIEKAINAIARLRQALFFVIQGFKELHDIQQGDWLGFMQEAKKNPPSVSDTTTSSFADAARNLFKRNSSSQIALQARALAQSVSTLTGVSPDILYAQWAHETGNFTNRGALQLNNLAGINVPGGNGQDYRKFSSLTEFGMYYADLLRRKYPGALGAQDVDSFATALKAGGYYGDSLSNYERGMKSQLGLFNGIRGASSPLALAGSAAGSSSSNVDNSVKTSIDKIIVNTQATDANGIARGLGQSMDFLFASQANTGLN